MTIPRLRNNMGQFAPRPAAHTNGATPQPLVPLISRVIGNRGLKNLAGRINEEYDVELKDWQKASKIYLEMRDDVVIGTLLDAIKLPLLAAEFDVQRGGDTAYDEVAARFLWANIQKIPRQSWRSHVTDMLECVDFGFAVSEVTLEKRNDGRMWLSSLAPRGQETLFKWAFDENDTATAFVQRDPDTGSQYVIPLDKCVITTFRGRKGNPQGKGILRDLWRSYKFLRAMEDYEGIGAERDVGGMPVAELPPEPIDEAGLVNLQTMLKNLRLDEQMYAIVPNGLKLSPYGSAGKSYDIGSIITRKKQEILMRGHAQFLMLGMDKAGTQALVKGSTDYFMLGLQAVQQTILEAWNQQLVPLLFRYNYFPDVTALPKIVWHDPGKADFGALIDAYAKGVTAKVITPIRGDEDFVRAVMDLPDLPDDIGEDVRSVEQPAVMYPGMFSFPGMVTN